MPVGNQELPIPNAADQETLIGQDWGRLASLVQSAMARGIRSNSNKKWLLGHPWERGELGKGGKKWLNN